MTRLWPLEKRVDKADKITKMLSDHAQNKAEKRSKYELKPPSAYAPFFVGLILGLLFQILLKLS